MKHFFNLGRNLQKLVVGGLLAAIIAVTVAPASTAMAAEAPVETTVNNAQESVLPAELTTSYFQLASDAVMPRSTTYFIHDQQFSFTGFYSAYPFYVPSACQARLVIAAIGNEPLYIDVLNGKLVSEHRITVTPNQSQVHVFNISAGDHSLRFSSTSGSTFTVRLQMYTWDY